MKLLALDPKVRLTPKAALGHPWLADAASQATGRLPSCAPLPPSQLPDAPVLLSPGDRGGGSGFRPRVLPPSPILPTQ